MKLFAVIPTIGERNNTLVPMVEQLISEDVTVIVIDNGEQDVARHVHPHTYIHSHSWDGEPVNLSMLWNFGLNWAEELAYGEEFVVAVFNDDLILPPSTVQYLANAIIENNAAAAYVSYLGFPLVARAGHPLNLGNRMVGYAFALLGNKKLRADEDFLWWWGDTDLDVRAREAGGVVAVPLVGFQHLDANGYTNRRPELYEQAGRDRQTFYEKHGYLPW